MQYGQCPKHPANGICGVPKEQTLLIEQFLCHHPTAEMSEHMKYIARPTLTRVAFIHQVSAMMPGTKRRKLKPFKEARFNHYTCGIGHAAKGLFYPGCNLKKHDKALLWAAPGIRKTVGWPQCVLSNDLGSPAVASSV